MVIRIIRVGGDIPVVHLLAQQCIADVAADEIRGKSCVLQFLRHKDRFFGNDFFGNRVKPGRQHQISVAPFCDLLIVLIDELIHLGREKGRRQGDIPIKKKRQQRRYKSRQIDVEIRLLIHKIYLQSIYTKSTSRLHLSQYISRICYPSGWEVEGSRFRV